MADPKNSRLDLSTPDKARKALHDLQAEQKRLKASNRDLMLNYEQKATDLAAIQKRLTEMENRKGSAGLGSNAQMKKYLRPDGSVRIKGEATRDQAYMPGLMTDKPVCDWQRDLQDAVNDYTMVKMLSGKGKAPKSLARVQEIARKAPVEVQRIFADVDTIGGDFIPDEMLPTMERNLTAQRRLAGAFDVMQLPNKTTLLPYLSQSFRPYIKAAAVADDPAQYTSSSLSTDQRTITASGLAVRAQIADDADEDSIITIMPVIQSELTQSLIDAEEDTLINGMTGTHSDLALASWNIRGRWGASGLGGSADHRRAWDGFRHSAFASGCTSDLSTAVISADDIMAHRAKLDSPHGVDGSLIFVVSPEVYFKSLLVMNEVQTMQNFPQPTIVSGELAQIYGMPVLISEFLSADLQTNGKFTSATPGATTSALLINRDRFKLGVRRGTSVELDKDITRGVSNMVCTVRETLVNVDPASKKNCHLAFNVLA